MILPPLTKGRLLRRYKRFLADIRLEDGTQITAHVPNTGSMRSTSAPESLVGLSSSDSADRKYRYTLEIIEGQGGAMVGVNTMRTNRIVEESVREGRISSLAGFDEIRREVPYGEASRIDLLLSSPAGRRCYVEVKNVTYKEGDTALFPDAVTERGTKHLRELEKMVEAGYRAVIFFLVNRNDCDKIAAARHIDPTYADALHRAASCGVEVISYCTRVSFFEITIERALEVDWNMF
jgi:sugar fermentation stimulation protein A